MSSQDSQQAGIGQKSRAKSKSGLPQLPILDESQIVSECFSEVYRRRVQGASGVHDHNQTTPSGQNLGANTKPGDTPRLPICGGCRDKSADLSQMSQPDPYPNNRFLSQEEPDCFTQFSELVSQAPPSLSPTHKTRSKRRRVAPTRYGDYAYPGAETERFDREEENLVDLDLTCPLWSQQSSLPSQIFQTTFLPANANYVQTGKNLSLQRALTPVATQAPEVTAPAAAKAPHWKAIRANEDTFTASRQSSSPLNALQCPPRFSELLAQSLQSQPSCRPPRATQASDCGIRKYFTSSVVLDPAKSSQTAIAVQEDSRGPTSGQTTLRQQILACLLEPDFEDFVAEVEKVWDELHESVSDNLESQVFGSLLEKDSVGLLSQSRSHLR